MPVVMKKTAYYTVRATQECTYIEVRHDPSFPAIPNVSGSVFTHNPSVPVTRSSKLFEGREGCAVSRRDPRGALLQRLRPIVVRM